MHADTTSRNELEIGAKLGAIIQNATARERLVANPTEVLAEVGIESDAEIFADTADLVHLVIPAQIDAVRLSDGDESYYEELGKAALGNCFYEDMPE
ncbi:hypothetical protein FMN63_26460 [Stappia sp. BW2]|uniref:hypothetical protein n=1 Tax=Stappia sp. BW2 TaxID=2592622 RepID=UPI0011DE7EDE|nr:hypothetical protein [Stappia sp. BW2]TYC65899.1 hypothetical protein FMN63_26460 [Stappia sp. BW2]